MASIQVDSTSNVVKFDTFKTLSVDIGQEVMNALDVWFEEKMKGEWRQRMIQVAEKEGKSWFYEDFRGREWAEERGFLVFMDKLRNPSVVK